MHGSCSQLFRPTTPLNGDRDSGFPRHPSALSGLEPLRTLGSNYPALLCRRGWWDEPSWGAAPPEPGRPLSGTPLPPLPPPQRAHGSPPWPRLLWQLATKTLSATACGSTSPAPRPHQAPVQRPPADGLRNCISIEKPLEQEGSQVTKIAGCVGVHERRGASSPS